jgi:hypothetical protein
VILAIHDRPADALMLMKEAYAIYQSRPAHERKLLDDTFQLNGPRRETALIAPERYLIWSFEHRASWGPGRVGYTTATHRAGIYTAEEANEICNEANRTAIEDLLVPAPRQRRRPCLMSMDSPSWQKFQPV